MIGYRVQSQNKSLYDYVVKGVLAQEYRWVHVAYIYKYT